MKKNEVIEAHPLAKLFPRMDADAMRELAADVKQRGLQEPITLHEGMVLDGVHRQEACAVSGVEPVYVHFVGQDPLAFVMSKNLQRRHLTPTQRAAIAVDALPFFEAEAKKRQAATLKRGEQSPLAPNDANGKTAGKAAAQAAKTTGASTRMVERAKRLKNESPAQFEQAKAGKLSLTKAERDGQQTEAAKLQREEALDRIEQVCGKSFTDAVERGTRLKTHKDLVAFAEQKDDDMRSQMRLIADLGWPLKKAQTFRSKNLTKNHRIQDLIHTAAANMRPFVVVIGGWTITADKPEK